MTPLIIGFAVVVAMLVAVVVDASAAYLRRQGLDSAADAAALAATDGIQGEAVYTHGLGRRARDRPGGGAALRGASTSPAAASRAASRDSTTPCRPPPTPSSCASSTPMDLPLHVPGVGTDVPVTGTAASVVVVSD